MTSYAPISEVPATVVVVIPLRISLTIVQGPSLRILHCNSSIPASQLSREERSGSASQIMHLCLQPQLFRLLIFVASIDKNLINPPKMGSGLAVADMAQCVLGIPAAYYTLILLVTFPGSERPQH